MSLKPLKPSETFWVVLGDSGQRGRTARGRLICSGNQEVVKLLQSRCMKLLALALLITFTQAASQEPRKAVDGSVQSTIKSDGGSLDETKPLPPTASNMAGREGPRNISSGEPKAQESGQILRIGEIPPVTVQPAKKDWADWGYWWFSLLLAVVGALQVWLLHRTLRSIKRQADLMDRQTSIQSAGMQQWIDIETKPPNPGLPENDPPGVALPFRAVNNTAFPLTIEKIVTKVWIKEHEYEEFTVSQKQILPPAREGTRGAYPFFVSKTLKPGEFTRGTAIYISGEVTFENCLQKTCTSAFEGLYRCAPGIFEKLEVLGYKTDQRVGSVEI